MKGSTKVEVARPLRGHYSNSGKRVAKSRFEKCSAFLVPPAVLELGHSL